MVFSPPDVGREGQKLQDPQVKKLQQNSKIMKTCREGALVGEMRPP